MWDGLIVRDAGVASMAQVIDALVTTGQHEAALRHITPEDNT